MNDRQRGRRIGPGWGRPPRPLAGWMAAALLPALAACATLPGLPPGIDVQLTVDSVGVSAWRIDLPVRGGSVGDVSGDNPTLTLEVGRRYRVVIPAANSVHPFELLGGVAAATTVLLSEKAGVDGSFEDDPGVDFVEDGDAVTFTLTPELAAVLTGYRCGLHPTYMRGAIVVAL